MSDNKQPDEQLRLSRFLSQAGIASRRKCDEMIKLGLVSVNAGVVLEPGFKVSPEDLVKVEGRLVKPFKEKIYIMLNKPRGYLCSSSDPYADKTIYDLIKLPGNPRIFSAGRLDLNSEGLLILTNDGDYAEKLTHPRYCIVKKYKVRINRRLTDIELKRIRSGIRDRGEFLKPLSVKQLKGSEYLFEMNEGKKREIRRLIASTGADVVQLERIAIGALGLSPLPRGKWKKMNKNERDLSLKRQQKARDSKRA